MKGRMGRFHLLDVLELETWFMAESEEYFVKTWSSSGIILPIIKRWNESKLCFKF